MNLKNTIQKLLNNEELNALEKAELENFDFSRISGDAVDSLQHECDTLLRE